MQKRFTIRRIAMIGIMAALTFAASLIQINIPTAIDNTRIHLGNVLCLMSGMILGPVSGGLAAGIGSMFFDLTNPLYVSSAPFTFAFKFIMAFVCGLIVWRRGSEKLYDIGNRSIGGACGAASYVILYLGRSFLRDTLFLRTAIQTAMIDVGTKALTSGINAVIAVIVAVPLSIAVAKGLERANLRL